MSCIHENLECINMESARQSVGSLLLTLTDQDPTKVVLTLLKLSPPGDSNGTAMWEVMLSVPHTLEKIFEELLSQLRRRKSHSPVESTIENAYITHLALLASTECQSEDCGNTCQRRSSLMTVSLLLRRLIPLSERPDMARKMPVLLPQISEFLKDGDTDIKTNILVIFGNVMGHLEGKEASPIAVQLEEEKLLPLFDAESSQLRELSISLFRDLVKAVVGNEKRMMKKKVQRTLLPLFFHTQDKTDSVSKASREALLAVAELLAWGELKDLVQPQQMWRTVEYSLLQDRSKVEVYVKQSLPYLNNAQATLRETAIRFIGLGARRLGDQNEMKLQDICNALKDLMYDAEPAVQCLAAQTLLILGTPRKQRTSGWSLQTLCCWLCRDSER
ncbi:maestro heat-like repeat-containing protein family member 7 [Numenius arquata]|uniref:maestro heat-like repeat-containing protein family member 7 n=1 Tax=Numenius arquata TaxID=31919 RepID=UPI003D30A2CE